MIVPSFLLFYLRYVSYVREGTFFLGGGGRAGASEGRVISESEHQRGGPYPVFQLFKERVTPFPEFLMEIFVMLFSIFL